MTTPCCPAQPDNNSELMPGDNRPGYKLWSFVCGWVQTPIGPVPRVTSQLTQSDILGRWQMRWGLGRSRYAIAPGLYALGTPSPDSPVLVTANYKMTFDLVRRDLKDHNLWLLVLDTKGVNVWCAAGKGTFGTSELLQRIRSSGLDQIVNHRELVLPQLGAPGVSAHKVKQSSGFTIIYGPVRCADLPRFLANGMTASVEMRRVTFHFSERLVLIPVELVNMRKQLLFGIPLLFFLGGIGPDIFSLSEAWARGSAAVASALTGVIAGACLAPLLLPWLPGQTFAFKGAMTGFVAGFIGCITFYSTLGLLGSIALLMTITTVSSWCTMHFTGSTPFTSPSGVQMEMRQALPAQAAALVVAGLSWLATPFV